MKKKIFSYDLDGTLLMSNNKVHPVTKKAFHDVHKKGGINILNTGRGLLKVLPLLDEFDGIDYFICSNGALIYDVKTKTYCCRQIRIWCFWKNVWICLQE